jgi:hypothetical protein
MWLAVQSRELYTGMRAHIAHSLRVLSQRRTRVVRLVAAADPARAVAVVRPGAGPGLATWLADVCTAGAAGTRRAHEAAAFVAPRSDAFVDELAMMLEHFAGARDGRARVSGRAPAATLAMWCPEDDRGVASLHIWLEDFPPPARNGFVVATTEPLRTTWR